MTTELENGDRIQVITDFLSCGGGKGIILYRQINCVSTVYRVKLDNGIVTYFNPDEIERIDDNVD